MLDTQLKFFSSNGKRQLLIVEDELINREILRANLEEHYEILTAASGEEGIERIRACKDTLSVVLLDLILPDMHGLDVLRVLKADHDLSRIPVIVMTADKESEVECLTEGAVDFIPKPYPNAAVILARVRRTIELSEDRDIIRWTERDQLTGLYNREYFYRYAEQFDLHHKELAMDAIVIDINHFHMINDRHGKAYGDEILKRIGEQLRAMVKDSDGIVCRREADTFLSYCPHRTDYSDMLDKTTGSLGAAGKNNSRVRLRMGIYSGADKTIDVERRFDRAKLAADTVRSSFTKAIAIYDDTLHESEIFEEQLLDGFRDAIEQKQFQVYFQPKYDIRATEPVLSSAEALVRWKHPELGMVSPGVFVPLFEKNGMIQELDSFVWRETAAQLRDWKTRLGVSVPASVNVSRVDLFDADLVQNMQNLVAEFGLSPDEFLLEITESAYTQDSDQIIDTVNRLRQVGFHIEMDDFGTGYSSLNMISSMPIDAMKLDMFFIRNAFSDRKDTRMLEVILEIADSLGVPTIAEGVETAEQMFTLKAMGCDIVQGYYFSKPLPAGEYENLLIRIKDTPAAAPATFRKTDQRQRRSKASRGMFTYEALHDPVTGLYNQSAFEMLLQDADQGHIAVLIADVDGFRKICEEQGKETGERVIRRAAEVLRQSFRSVDYVCRIRSDEFAVIMTRVNSSMRKLIFDKIDQVNQELETRNGDLPGVSLCVGVAFSDRENPQGDIFQDADTALFRMKEVRRCGCAIY